MTDTRLMAQRAWFALCLGLGHVLRASKYSRTVVWDNAGRTVVRKRRAFYASLLVWLSGPLMRVLNTGVRVLPQRQWEAREREMYSRLYNTAVGVRVGGPLDLPYLGGRTLAALLADRSVPNAVRLRAVEHAVVALRHFHAQGETHGDAMAENVMVDLDGGIARWFDFETVHEAARPLTWRRADDLRALLTTCILRTPADQHAAIARLVMEVYDEPAVRKVLASFFPSLPTRPLPFHLGQAPLSIAEFRRLGDWCESLAGDDS